MNMRLRAREASAIRHAYTQTCTCACVCSRTRSGPEGWPAEPAAAGRRRQRPGVQSGSPAAREGPRSARAGHRAAAHCAGVPLPPGPTHHGHGECRVFWGLVRTRNHPQEWAQREAQKRCRVTGLEPCQVSLSAYISHTRTRLLWNHQPLITPLRMPTCMQLWRTALEASFLGHRSWSLVLDT